MVKAEVRSAAGRKPKNARSKRALSALMPQVLELGKNPLLLKGENASGLITQLLKDIRGLRASDSRLLSRNTGVNPFNDASSCEFLCERNNCSLFVYGSHSKKRPHNLVFGRIYSGHILDMYEFGVENVKLVEEFVGEDGSLQPRIGSRPLILMQGQGLDGVSTDAAKFKNFFIDYFRCHESDGININGIEHAVLLAEHEGKLRFRHYAVRLRRIKGQKAPEVR